MKYLKKFETIEDKHSLEIIKDIVQDLLDSFNFEEASIDRFSENNIWEMEIDQYDKLFYVLKQSGDISFPRNTMLYTQPKYKENTFFMIIKYVNNLVLENNDIEVDDKFYKDMLYNINIHIKQIVRRLKGYGFSCEISHMDCDNNEVRGEEATYSELIGYYHARILKLSIHKL